MTSVIIKRAQIGKSKGIDVTVRSSQGWARYFAPTWEMVEKHKKGEMSNEKYIKLYSEILSKVPIKVWANLYNSAVNGIITILCYCRDEWFCHTYLLIDYAVKHFPSFFRTE